MVGELNGLGCALTAASRDVVSKALVGQLGVIGLSALRSVVASLCALSVLLVTGRFSDLFLLPPTLTGFLFVGVLGFALGDLAFLLALRLEDASRVLPVASSLFIFFSMVASGFVAGEVLGWHAGAGGALVMIGIYLVVLSRGRQWGWRGLRTRGVAIALLAAVLWTLGTLGLNQLMRNMDTLVVLTFRLIGMALTFLCLLPMQRTPLRARDAGVRNLLLLVGVGLMTYVTSLLFLMALRYSTVATAVILTSTAPVFGVPLAALFLKERLAWWNVQGIAMAIVGTWLTVLGRPLP